MAESEDWIYTWIGLLILSPILIPLLILLSPILIILAIISQTEGYADEEAINSAREKLEKEVKEYDEREDLVDDKETLSLKKKIEHHIEKLEYNLINYHNQAKAINLDPERRDAYWCNGCEHNWVSRNIAGKSYICPKCRGDDLDNTHLSERKKQHQTLINNHKIGKKQIKDFSKSVEILGN